MDTSTAIILALIPAVTGIITTLGGIWLTHHLTGRREQELRSRLPTSPASETESFVITILSEPPSIPAPTLQIGVIFRDAGLLIILTAVAGFVGVLLAAVGGIDDAGSMFAVVGCLNILLLIVGFTISASMVNGMRWQHITIVALIVWIFGIVNILIGLADVAIWLESALYIAFCGAIGGGLSYVFKRPGLSNRT